MERPKKSCSCFGFFNKKVPKKINEVTETQQVIRSSLINFSSQFQSDDYYLNNSLGSTQKLQGNVPLNNTLTSAVCRTPSLFQLSGAQLRESTANSGKCGKPLNEEETLQTRNSVPYKVEEDNKVQMVFEEEKKTEEKKIRFEESQKEEEKKPKANSFDYSIKSLQDFVNKVEVKEQGKVLVMKEETEKDFKDKENKEIKTETEEKKQSGVFEEEKAINIIGKTIEIKEDKKDINIDQISKIEIKEEVKISQIGKKSDDAKENGNRVAEDARNEFILNYEEEKIQKSNFKYEKQDDCKLVNKKNEDFHHSAEGEIKSQEYPVVICEIIEQLDIKTENIAELKMPKLNPDIENPVFSKEEPVFKMLPEDFQIDSSLKKPDEPVFIKLAKKSEDSETPPEEIDIVSPINPEKSLKLFSSLSPKGLLNPLKKLEDFQDNIFIKGAAKKSFQNLVNRISSEKKLKKISDRLKLPSRRNSLLIHPEQNPQIISPLGNEVLLKNSQEILKNLNIRAKITSIDQFNKNSLKNQAQIDEDYLESSHSKSQSVQNSMIIHENKEKLKKTSKKNDSECLFPGKKIKLGTNNCIQSSSVYMISPRNSTKRLPSLKISPIKSILSVDDYSDILSFLKNSPCGEIQIAKVPDLKKNKLPALKPITPHYFYKKRSAPQLKQKTRILIEHL